MTTPKTQTPSPLAEAHGSADCCSLPRRERVYLQEVKEEDGEVWLRVSAANAPRGTPPVSRFAAGQILIIENERDRYGSLQFRLGAHIAMMAPHQKERRTGSLLIEAAEEIRCLHAALCDLMPYVLEDYYPNCATPGYRAAVESAKALTMNA